jgi:hypothetical protein
MSLIPPPGGDIRRGGYLATCNTCLMRALLYWLAIASAARRASAMIVRLGDSPPPDVGKVLASVTQRFGLSCARPSGSTTEAELSVPILAVPKTCVAVRASRLLASSTSTAPASARTARDAAAIWRKRAMLCSVKTEEIRATGRPWASRCSKSKSIPERASGTTCPIAPTASALPKLSRSAVLNPAPKPGTSRVAIPPYVRDVVRCSTFL